MERSIVVRDKRVDQISTLVDIYKNPHIAKYVLSLNEMGLETTKMWLLLLDELESASGKELDAKTLTSSLQSLITNPELRRQVIQVYNNRLLK